MWRRRNCGRNRRLAKAAKARDIGCVSGIYRQRDIATTRRYVVEDVASVIADEKILSLQLRLVDRFLGESADIENVCRLRVRYARTITYDHGNWSAAV
jgi:hypothetical protein